MKGVEGGARERHGSAPGSAPEVPRRAPRCTAWRRGPIPGRSGIFVVRNPPMAWISNHARSMTGPAWFEMVAMRPFRTTRAPDRPDSRAPATDPSPGCHGSVTEVGPRHEDAGNAGLLPVLPDGDGRARALDPTGGGSSARARPRPSGPGPRRAPEGRGCDVPGISVTDRAEVWRLSDPIVTEVRPRAPAGVAGGGRRGRRPRPATSS